MSTAVVISGVDQVMKNLNILNSSLGQAFATGLLKGGLFLQRESQKICPVDTGNMKGGAFTRPFGNGFKTVVVVGYVAYYAPWQHENLEFRHQPGQQAKFLEQPSRDKADQVFDIVAQSVGVPMTVAISKVTLTYP